MEIMAQKQKEHSTKQKYDVNSVMMNASNAEWLRKQIGEAKRQCDDAQSMNREKSKKEWQIL